MCERRRSRSHGRRKASKPDGCRQRSRNCTKISSMRAVWFTIGAAALVACAKTPSISIGELSDAGLRAKCERLTRCGMFVSVDACSRYFRAPPPDSYTPAIRAGRLDYNGQRAKDCEDALGVVSCDVTSREARVPPAPCIEMFHGKIADGDPCSFDEECASSRCNLPICAEGVCCVGACGTSRPPGRRGDPCDRTSECVDGYCAADMTCQPLGTIGQSCMNDSECGYDLACLQATPSLPGQCGAAPHLGQLCPYQRCADIGTICDGSTHCAAVGLPHQVCVAHRDCSIFLECDQTTHVCADLPTLGMSCDVSCAGESWCNFGGQPIGTCVVPNPNGVPCENSAECASQNCMPGPVFASCQDFPVCY
jgi:hypothetical protein